MVVLGTLTLLGASSVFFIILNVMRVLHLEFLKLAYLQAALGDAYAELGEGLHLEFLELAYLQAVLGGAPLLGVATAGDIVSVLIVPIQEVEEDQLAVVLGEPDAIGVLIECHLAGVLVTVHLECSCCRTMVGC